MRRKVPQEPPEWHASEGMWESLEVRLRLITPMFGGGYSTREVDELVPIRAATVRGHLRFWWRATAGAKYADVPSLYHAERALWGGASTRESPAVSKVVVQVAVHNHGKEVPWQAIAPKATPRDGPLHGYFLFPFQEQRRQGIPAAVGRQDVEFSVILRWAQDTLSEEQKQEVENALKAWIALGGVGARTRRGCGALTVVSHNAAQWLPSARTLQEWFQSLLPSAPANPKPQWTLLKGARIAVGEKLHPDALDAWRELGRFWAQFRKGHFDEYKPMSAGEWKDYQQLSRHRSQTEQIALAKPFLGLPIIYQRFPKVKFVGRLEPVGSGRMASPVIVKPLALSEGRFASLVAVLNAPVPNQIYIDKQVVRLLHPSPQQEPLLRAIGANTVLEAVIAVARQRLNAHLFTL